MTTGTITADAAGTWQLGDLTVHRLGFGAMRLPGTIDRVADRERSVAVLHRLLDLGVNHIDTGRVPVARPRRRWLIMGKTSFRDRSRATVCP